MRENGKWAKPWQEQFSYTPLLVAAYSPCTLREGGGVARLEPKPSQCSTSPCLAKGPFQQCTLPQWTSLFSPQDWENPVPQDRSPPLSPVVGRMSMGSS